MTIDLARTAGAGLKRARSVFFGASLVAALAAAPTPPTPPPGSVQPGGPSPVGAAPVPLGSAQTYAVLGNGSVTSTGESVVQGDLGIFPGASLTGFPPGTVNGAVRLGNAEAQRAQADLTAAHEAAIHRPPTASVGPELAGRTLAPGIYRTPENVTINGTLTLDARGDPQAVFVFQLGSALTTSENSRVQVINSPRPPCNVVWSVGNSAILGPGSQFVGRLIATNSVTVRFASTVAEGGALSRGGDVRLDSAVVRRPECAPGSPSAGATTPRGSAPPTRGSAPPTRGSAPPTSSTPPATGSAPPATGSAPPATGSASPTGETAPPTGGIAPPTGGGVPSAPGGVAPPAPPGGVAPPPGGGAPPAGGGAPPAGGGAPPAGGNAPPEAPVAPPGQGEAPLPGQ